MAQSRPQTSNYHIKSFVNFGLRLLTITALLHLGERRGTNVSNMVNAANIDKVAFQIFEIDSTLQDILWCGNTNEVILVQSQKGTIYRSRDKGESWKKLHSAMHQSGQNVLEDGQTDIGQVRKMVQSPVDDSLVVFTGTKGINWVTEDCGANLRALNSGKKIHEFNYHPSQRAWALAAGWTSCDDFQDDEPCVIQKELYVTKDMGVTWQFLKSYVFDFSWGTTTYSSTLPAHEKAKNNEARIFITHEPDNKGHQKTRERWKETVHLYYSDDFFKTQHYALDAGNSIVMTKHYMFVAKAISSTRINIHVSRAEGGFLDFKQARLPKDFHMTDHFTVMDTSEKSVFLYVSDPDSNNRVGNLFMSDGLGYRFTHSVENIIKGHAVDFETIESLDGTFIANRYDRGHGTLKKGDKHMGGISQEDILNEQAKQEEKTGGNKMSNPTASKNQENTKSAKRDEVVSVVDFESKIKTYMTHSKGSEWSLIRAPEQDLRGKSTNCFLEDHCSLHIQMFYNNHQNYAPPYSQESAMGVVMAIGNLGQNLDLDVGARKGTFLSRDGGIQWTEIAKIPLIYEMGDHGAILLAAPNTESTKQIRYSWDEGKTWNKLEISEVPIFVDNIIIEPKSTAQQFVIYGAYDNTTEESEWDISDDTNKARQNEDTERGHDVMVSIDFSNLHEPKCKGVESPGSEHSDFENWSPHDGRHGTNNKCFLGQQVTYVRRKQGSECYNGEDFERQVMRVPCLCTESDYECDVDFVKNSDGTCRYVKDDHPFSDHKNWQYYDNSGEDCKAENFYYQTKGYRKIPGNKCYGGVKLDPSQHPCHNMAYLNSYLGSYPGIILVALIFGCYFFWEQIEPVLATLPIPDPKNTIAMVTALFAATFGNFINIGSSAPSQGQSAFSQGGVGYNQNLDNAPEPYLEADDDDSHSDEGLGGKPLSPSKDNNDSDDDDEEAPNKNSGQELIDLGESSSPSIAKKIPKLSGPK